MDNFKQIKLKPDVKKEKELKQKKYIIDNIEKIIEEIKNNIKYFNDFKHNNNVLKSDLFKVQQLILNMDKQTIYIYKILELATKKYVYAIYNSGNNSFFTTYQKLVSHSTFPKDKEYLKETFDTFKSLQDVVLRYKYDDFTIINYNKAIYLNNIHKCEKL